MRSVKIGVIGAGYWGPNLIRNLWELEDASLNMVCDKSPNRLDHVKNLYPHVVTSKDHRDILESDVEGVVIATPVSTHYKLAMDCLKAGKHVLIEKPMAGSSYQANEIFQTGLRLGKIVMTGHTFVYNPAVIAMKEIIQSGEIGDVFYLHSTRVNLGLYQPDTNVLWDLAPHDISILLYILGMEPVSVSAHGGTFLKKGVFDVANISLRFPGQVMANVQVSWLDPCKIRRITVVGNKKMVVFDDIEVKDKLKIYDKGIDIQPYTDTFNDFQLAYRYGDVTTVPLEWEEPLRKECRHFLECIRDGKQARSDGYQGLKVVQILESAQQSLVHGGTRQRCAVKQEQFPALAEGIEHDYVYSTR